MAAFADDNRRVRGVEEDDPTVCPHSAAFSVQSLRRGGKVRDPFQGGGIRCALTWGDQVSSEMLAQS